MLQNTSPEKAKAWSELEMHFSEMESVRMQDLFFDDKQRAEKMHVCLGDLLFDYSKNKITAETISLLSNLAQASDLKGAIEKMFTGERINKTEDRAVLHTALRDFSFQREIVIDGVNVLEEIKTSRQKIKEFSTSIIQGKLRGATGKQFTDVINIGIGGSDLGPKMVVEGLGNYRNHLGVHYVSNIDSDFLFGLLAKLNPETTLVLIVSKTFTTHETMENAKRVVKWLSNSVANVKAHLVGVTSNTEKACEYGIEKDFLFPMWDYIGGRFSLWGSVGLSIALGVGYENFERLLKGAYSVDEHFRNEDFSKNIPVLMGLIGVWYNNFYKYQSEAIVPYNELLRAFPAHLQQMIMESNGKDRDCLGDLVEIQTSPIVWGEVGSSAQHAFFQLFHQGTKVIPTDFIGFVQPFCKEDSTHDILMSNFFGQTEALLVGKSGEALKADTLPYLGNYRAFEGNKPTNTLLLNKLTPESLGMLVALYEHKTFVQGVIWNIFSFDQFGVEYGKVLAKNIENEIISKNIGKHDSSTSFLLNYYLMKS